MIGQGRAGGMREPNGAGGMTGHGGNKGTRSQSEADGSDGRGGVRVSKTGGGDSESSKPEVAGDMKSHSTTDPLDMAC